MTTESKQKRLDAVEIALTPKEWAVRMIEVMRHPSDNIWKDTITAANIVKQAFTALKEQAAEKHPGKKPEDGQARKKLGLALYQEFMALKCLWGHVNEDVGRTATVDGLKATLNLSRLEIMVRQDAFGRTARKAAEWVQEYKTADADDEENRQIMLKELAAYTDFNLGEKWGDSIPLPGDIRVRFPSALEEWIERVTALAVEVYGYRDAVQVIQKDHFDGHPVLYLGIEAELSNVIKRMEEGIEAFNDYLKTRAELFAPDWDAEEEHEGGATAIPGEREGKLNINPIAVKTNAAKIVADWIKQAKTDAKQEILASSDPAEANTFIFDVLREEWEKSREV